MLSFEDCRPLHNSGKQQTACGKLVAIESSAVNEIMAIRCVMSRHNKWSGIMFAIRILPKSERGPEGERLGEITIGDFTERFVCYVPESAELEWKVQLQSLLDGEEVVALVHDLHFAWVVYREGMRCFVQQRLSLDSQFKNLLPRVTVTEDGRRVSEWSTTIEAIRRFVHA